MSEARDLNPADGPTSDPERLLQSLAPQPLDANRDDLFFRAGYAAGAHHRGMSLVWPSAAAALLLVSLTLGTSLIHDRLALNLGATAGLSSSAAGATADVSSETADHRFRQWRRLVSSPPPVSARLTALGWIESASTSPADQSQTERKSNPPPHRDPPTYFELLRNYRES